MEGGLTLRLIICRAVGEIAGRRLGEPRDARPSGSFVGGRATMRVAGGLAPDGVELIDYDVVPDAGQDRLVGRVPGGRQGRGGSAGTPPPTSSPAP